MDENIRVIEVNGCKVEVDLRYAKRIDTFKIGDNVKILDRRNNENKMRCGVITDFADFKDLPTMIIAVYHEGRYSWENDPRIEFLTYNAETEDIEIVATSNEELLVSKDTIIQHFDDKILKASRELHDMIQQRDTFIKYFGSGEEEKLGDLKDMTERILKKDL